MNSNLTIPDNIVVGFQNRSDTYSGKLAFVVFKDKNKLRQEKSWEGWRDKKIAKEEYANEPTNGFVLNKDVGGGSSYSYYTRREKARVYDPRGFEFEITLANLLFILQECSSLKGKGLEGDFVYSWSGSDIILLPVDSEEYRSSVTMRNLKEKKVDKKDIVEGHVYRTKDDERVMYLGRHLCYREEHYNRWSGTYYSAITPHKKHVFFKLNDEKLGKYMLLSGFVKLAEKVGDEPAANYAEEYEAFMSTPIPSKLEKTIFIHKKLSEIDKKHYRDYGGNPYYESKVPFWQGIYCKVDDKCYFGDYEESTNIFKATNEVIVGGKCLDFKGFACRVKLKDEFDVNNIGMMYYQFENGSKVII